MNDLWSDCIRGLVPYVPGEQPHVDGLIKLNTNENPYPPSPAALAAIQQAAEQTCGCIRTLKAVVVIDEAYVDFGGETVIPLISEFPNLLVTQTLSKSRSLAGLRVGFAVGQPSLIQALDRVKGCFNSYPLDRLAIVGAVAAIRDHESAVRGCADARER